MSRRYDQSTTTFSPEGLLTLFLDFHLLLSSFFSPLSHLFFITGRLHQVEYAIEAINNAGTCIGIQSIDGIVLAAEKKTISKLLAPSKSSEKTFVIDDHVSCLIAGLTADANILIHQARLGSQRSESF
jgi:20S proteasome subunit alpha 3